MASAPFPPTRSGCPTQDAAKARAGRFNVAVVLHTTSSDWARQELAGIAATLGAHSAAVVEVVDCGFDRDRQNSELLRLRGAKIDAVISIPDRQCERRDRAPGHRPSRQEAGSVDSAPSGMSQGDDYVAVVSSDNSGLGEIAAELLSPFLPEEGVAGILTYSADFFATNEREIGFRKWIGRHRPDVTIVRGRFDRVEGAQARVRAAARRERRSRRPVRRLGRSGARRARRLARGLAANGRTTFDLGNAIAEELLQGDYVKGVVAQLPYDQGRAAALVSLLALVGRAPPSWIATPGLAVTSDNVVEAYQFVWHMPAPDALRRLRL